MIGPYQVLPLQARVDLGVMAMTEYSIFPRATLIGASPSDSLMSYPRHLLAESYPSTEMQSVYSTAPTDWDRWEKWEANFTLWNQLFYSPLYKCISMILLLLQLAVISLDLKHRHKVYTTIFDKAFILFPKDVPLQIWLKRFELLSTDGFWGDILSFMFLFLFFCKPN